MEKRMNEEAEKLLMMFIKDGYKNVTGKIGKKTALAMMCYVNKDAKLQQIVNNGDYTALLKYRAHPQAGESK
jgi:Holliday junction resolvasome RuvABC DNA-binding subunit